MNDDNKKLNPFMEPLLLQMMELGRLGISYELKIEFDKDVGTTINFYLP
jgi:hypothetical protein